MGIPIGELNELGKRYKITQLWVPKRTGVEEDKITDNRIPF